MSIRRDSKSPSSSILFVFSNEKCLVFVGLFFGDEENESNWNAAAICWQKIDNSGAINKRQTFMM